MKLKFAPVVSLISAVVSVIDQHCSRDLESVAGAVPSLHDRTVIHCPIERAASSSIVAEARGTSAAPFQQRLHFADATSIAFSSRVLEDASVLPSLLSLAAVRGPGCAPAAFFHHG